MAIKTASAKAKGRGLQKYCRDRITETFDELQEGDCVSCAMGSGGIDIQLSPLARKVFPVSVECKKTKKTPTRQELKQSQYNAYPGTLAGVAWCPHGSGPDKTMIMFDFNEFLKWLRERNGESV